MIVSPVRRLRKSCPSFPDGADVVDSAQSPNLREITSCCYRKRASPELRRSELESVEDAVRDPETQTHESASYFPPDRSRQKVWNVFNYDHLRMERPSPPNDFETQGVPKGPRRVFG